MPPNQNAAPVIPPGRNVAPVIPPNQNGAPAVPPSAPPANGDRRGRHTAAVIVAIVLVVILVAGTAIAAALTGGFGLLGDNASTSQSAQDNGNAGSESDADQSDANDNDDQDATAGDSDDKDTDTSDDGARNPEVRDAVDDYSWEELSRISALIAAAGDDEEGLAVAERYRLCDSDGTLDGSQRKTVTLKDGTETSAQIAGFRQDERSDGGLAGITFIFTDAVATHAMDAGDSNAGGWRDSDLRGWMNSEILARLPSDLQRTIVAADKYTNNVGHTYDADAVTVTSDKLWLPSYNEIIGDVDASLSDNLEVFNAEGDKYRLFVDTDVLWSAENPILVKHLAGGSEPVSWWQRSPYPDNADYFMDTGADGIPFYAHVPGKDFGVVPGFCI